MSNLLAAFAGALIGLVTGFVFARTRPSKSAATIPGLPGEERLVWLQRLRTRFPRAVWLNPIPQKGWYGWTIKLIGELFPMFPLTLDGLEAAVDQLRRRAPEPVPDLAAIWPGLG